MKRNRSRTGIMAVLLAPARVAPRGDNLRILKITEVDAVRGSIDSVEGTWATIKARYRSLPPPELQRDSIDETIQYFAYVWRHKLYNEYDQVLHDQFEFVPLERDAEDFPWLEGLSWPKTIELTLAEHMFDSGFAGEESPVDVIDMTLTELSRQTLPGNIVEVNCSQRGSVITDAYNGWSFDTRTLLEIVPDPDEPGLFQIKKQTEVDAFLRSVEDNSWGLIKSLYR